MKNERVSNLPAKISHIHLFKLQPFLPSHITNIRFLLASPLDFLQSACISLKAQRSKLSTAQYRTSQAAAKIESFPPIFHGNHIVNLPDFNSLRRLMHSVCDSTYCQIPMCHTAAWPFIFFINVYIICSSSPHLSP